MGHLKISGLSFSYPNQTISNFDLTKLYETSDEWIYSRTGIKNRHIFKNNNEAYTLAKKTAEEAILQAKINKNDIDLILVSSSATLQTMPSIACIMQDLLQISNHSPAFDISAACSGFTYGLHLANAYIEANIYKNILLITLDNNSNIVDWTDRSTSVLFGDGVGALVLTSSNEQNVFALKLQADGKESHLITANTFVGNCPYKEENTQEKFMKMKGQDVYKFVSNKIPPFIEEDLLKKNNISIDDIDYFVFHQANQRIILNLQKKLGCPENKVLSNIENYGNMSSTSVVAALYDELKKKKQINSAKVLFCSFGAGMTWGGGILNVNLTY